MYNNLYLLKLPSVFSDIFYSRAEYRIIQLLLNSSDETYVVVSSWRLFFSPLKIECIF